MIKLFIKEQQRNNHSIFVNARLRYSSISAAVGTTEMTLFRIFFLNLELKENKKNLEKKNCRSPSPESKQNKGPKSQNAFNFERERETEFTSCSPHHPLPYFAALLAV